MGRQYGALTERLKAFIAAQKLFFVGTAAASGRINVSPKGMDTLRILDDNHIAWLNLTGSGNETAAHVRESRRMTLMLCAFAGDPLILRIYGSARIIHPRDADWHDYHALFNPLPGARQIFALTIDLVQTSCGMGVPLFDYTGDRQELIEWADRKGEAGLQAYRAEKNRLSLDGRPTGILEED